MVKGGRESQHRCANDPCETHGVRKHSSQSHAHLLTCDPGPCARPPSRVRSPSASDPTRTASGAEVLQRLSLNPICCRWRPAVSALGCTLVTRVVRRLPECSEPGQAPATPPRQWPLHHVPIRTLANAMTMALRTTSNFAVWPLRGRGAEGNQDRPLDVVDGVRHVAHQYQDRNSDPPCCRPFRINDKRGPGHSARDSVSTNRRPRTAAT